MTRIRRSILYTPATRPDRVRKGLKKGADTLVVDLEDAVGPDEKENARVTAANVAALPHDASDTEVAIRINASGSPWFEADLEAMAEAGPSAIVLPKVEDAATVQRVHKAMPDTPIIVILETAKGVLNAVDIGLAAPTVEALLFGAEDYAADVGAVRSRENTEVLWARSRVVAAARVAGAAPIDQVFVDYKDVDGLAAEAQEARRLGFTGKQCIHPDQIAAIHAAFTPSREEAEEASDLLKAVEEAGIGDGGVLGYKGRMIDRPLIEQARRIVQLARHAGVLDG